MDEENISRIWVQTVHYIGEDKYTEEEWKQHYKDFIHKMVYDTKPTVTIDTREQLAQGIVKTKPGYSGHSMLDIQNLPLTGGKSTATKMWQQRFASQQQPVLSGLSQKPPIQDLSQLRVLRDPNKSQSQLTQSVCFKLPNNPSQKREQSSQLPNADYRIPRVPQLPGKQAQFSAFKTPGEMNPLQQIYNASCLTRTNASMSEIRAMVNAKAAATTKKQGLETDGLYKPLAVPNVNLANIQDKGGKSGQELKKPLAAGNKKDMSVDEFLQSATVEAFNFEDDDLSDVFNNIAEIEKAADASNKFNNNVSSAFGTTSEASGFSNNVSNQPQTTSEEKKKSKKGHKHKRKKYDRN